MNPQERKLYNRLRTIQRKICEIDTDEVVTELQNLIANASVAIDYAIEEVLNKQKRGRN